MYKSILREFKLEFKTLIKCITLPLLLLSNAAFSSEDIKCIKNDKIIYPTLLN